MDRSAEPKCRHLSRGQAFRRMLARTVTVEQNYRAIGSSLRKVLGHLLDAGRVTQPYLLYGDVLRRRHSGRFSVVALPNLARARST